MIVIILFFLFIVLRWGMQVLILCEKRKVPASIDKQIQLADRECSSSVMADLTSDQSGFGRCLLFKSALGFSGPQSEVCFICRMNISVELWIMEDA